MLTTSSASSPLSLSEGARLMAQSVILFASYQLHNAALPPQESYTWMPQKPSQPSSSLPSPVVIHSVGKFLVLSKHNATASARRLLTN